MFLRCWLCFRVNKTKFLIGHLIKSVRHDVGKMSGHLTHQEVSVLHSSLKKCTPLPLFLVVFTFNNTFLQEKVEIDAQKSASMSQSQVPKV